MKKRITTALISVIFITPGAFAGVQKSEGTTMPHHKEMMDKHSIDIGQPGRSAEINKTLSVTANDQMKFSLNNIEVKAGQTIEFVITNSGQQPHEFVLDTREKIETHRQEMAAMSEMQHADSNALSLRPGETKTLVWKFTSAGEFLAACTLPGHYEAGMLTKIKVGNQ